MKKFKICLSTPAKDLQTVYAFDKINELGSMCKGSRNTKCILMSRFRGRWKKERGIDLWHPP